MSYLRNMHTMDSYNVWFSILFLVITVLLFAFSAAAILRFFKEQLTVTPISFSEVVVTKMKADFLSIQFKLFSTCLLFCVCCVIFHLLFHITELWGTSATIAMYCCFWIPWIILKTHQTLPRHYVPFYERFRKTLNTFTESFSTIPSV